MLRPRLCRAPGAREGCSRGLIAQKRAIHAPSEPTASLLSIHWRPGRPSSHVRSLAAPPAPRGRPCPCLRSSPAPRAPSLATLPRSPLSLSLDRHLPGSGSSQWRSWVAWLVVVVLLSVSLAQYLLSAAEYRTWCERMMQNPQYAAVLRCAPNLAAAGVVGWPATLPGDGRMLRPRPAET